MKTRILSRVLCLGIAAAFALPVAGTAVAQQTLQTIHVHAPAGVHPVALLSNATGLTERQVQMVLGDRSSYAGYKASYDAADRKFEKALGPEIYQHVKSRHELSPQDVQNLTAMTNARKAQ
ncbi:MAG: hypothetical protein ACREPS_01990 [Rhodanobacteraceae bacterium]